MYSFGINSIKITNLIFTTTQIFQDLFFHLELCNLKNIFISLKSNNQNLLEQNLIYYEFFFSIIFYRNKNMVKVHMVSHKDLLCGYEKSIT